MGHSSFLKGVKAAKLGLAEQCINELRERLISDLHDELQALDQPDGQGS
jgi:hypothetical protein